MPAEIGDRNDDLMIAKSKEPRERYVRADWAGAAGYRVRLTWCAVHQPYHDQRITFGVGHLHRNRRHRTCGGNATQGGRRGTNNRWPRGIGGNKRLTACVGVAALIGCQPRSRRDEVAYYREIRHRANDTNGHGPTCVACRRWIKGQPDAAE